MKYNFTKSGLKVTDENTNCGAKVSYGAFALAVAEAAYIGKGIKDNGILGGLKNMGKLMAAEVAFFVPSAILHATGNEDNWYAKGYDRAADFIGTKPFYEEEQ